MASVIRYIFSDIRSNQVIDEISLRGVRMTSKLNDWGSLNGTFNLDQSGKNNADLISATTPGRCGITVERDNVPIWDGIVWARTYQSQAKVLQLAARTREAYLDHVLIKSDLVFENVEQRNIFRELFNTLQADPAANLGIIVPSAFSTVATKSITVLASDYKTFASAISAIADGSDGFDWTIAVAKSGDFYVRTLRIGYPTLGTIQPGITFEYPGNIHDYYKTESTTPGGTHIYVLGAGEGTSMLVGTFANSEMTNSLWPRYDLLLSKKDLNTQAMVNDHAEKLGVVRKAPYTTFKAFVRGDADPTFGGYGLGDTVQLVLDDARHPESLTTTARLVAYAYWPPSNDEVEKVELIFEGDELNDG